MNATAQPYEPLDTDSLPARLSGVDAVTRRLGDDFASWRVREVGDGNLNLVFIVESDKGSVVVKQALPYVRLVGDSWPLPLSRSFFEYHALIRQEARAPGSVPAIYHFDEEQALIVMQFLSPHHILRQSLQKGIEHNGLGVVLGTFCANTLFKGSDFSMDAAVRKQDVALFSGNTALCDITESLVFTDPFFDAPMNRHTSPQLDNQVAQLRGDVAAKRAAQQMKQAFCSRAETLLHGDLHTGSVMVSADDAIVIDPEFALYGPMGFDVGMLIGNFIMAWCAQSGYATENNDREAYRDWILSVVEDIWNTFGQRFSHLWTHERTGILFPASMFEDQGHHDALEQALAEQLDHIWTDAMGFCGCEIIRRTLGLAHIIEYDEIEDATVRARCESMGLTIARKLLVERSHIKTVGELIAVVAASSNATEVMT
ncbi:MAG: S-methyl-5-thioribose kinase [Granulosicoccus sp.]